MGNLESNVTLAEGSDYTVKGLELYPAFSEMPSGYMRRFKLFTYTGKVAFGITPERHNRDFYLDLTIEDRELSLHSRVLGDGTAALLDWMLDDTAMKELIDESVFAQETKV